MTETLQVDTDGLNAASKILKTAAGQIPVAPPQLSVPGTDPLSLAIAQGARQVEAPLAALPGINANATSTAEKIGVAGQKYRETDETLAQKAKQQQFDEDDTRKRGGQALKDDADDKGWEKPRKYGKEYSKSIGKGVTTPGQDDPPIWTKGEVEDKWGTPTDLHQYDAPETGDYDFGDAGKGDVALHAPEMQGQAYATKTTDGVSGKAAAEAWATQADFNWSSQSGRFNANANAAVGLEAKAEGALTDHGVFGGAEVFVGAKAEATGGFNFGPLHWTGSAAGAVGAGAGAHGGFGYQDGHLTFGADANLAWGVGGGLGSHLSIDLRAIGDGLKHAEEWLENVLQAATP
jgi:hypothetical protein